VVLLRKLTLNWHYTSHTCAFPACMFFNSGAVRKMIGCTKVANKSDVASTICSILKEKVHNGELVNK
jgi:hypothetical protein